MWKGKLLALRKMTTVEGRDLQIIEWGNLNYNQGPDFSNAKIILDGVSLFGDIELHLQSRDWFRHGHHLDPHYNNVILHVVLDSKPVMTIRQDGTEIPTLSIGDRVSLLGQKKAQQILQAQPPLPCTPLLGQATLEQRDLMLQQARQARAEQKLEQVNDLVIRSGGDWEEALWKMLAGHIGGPVNKAAFQEIATRVRFGILRKCIQRPIQVEAALFGAAGLLHPTSDSAYHAQLRDEWCHLSQKFELQPFPVPLKLHRMRPASFPVFRLSQLAELIVTFQGLFPLMTPAGIDRFLGTRIETTSYWRRYSGFGERCKITAHAIGPDLRQTLLLNALLPFQVAFHARQHADDPNKQLCAAWQKYPAENNRIIRTFVQQGWQVRHAGDSQAIIYLHTQLCATKGCLRCPVGQQILTKNPALPSFGF
jgi:Protein of unknown function (DUF2851)